MKTNSTLPSFFGLSVLVVDADPVARQATRAVAFRLGLTVASADDGDEAIAALRAHPVDAVLVALDRPGLDGLQATRAIRSQPTRWADVPVLALSTRDGDDERMRCLEAGLDDLLASPPDAARLAAALDALCAEPVIPAGR
jgi:CheY-like chemotaxis protein